MFTLKVINNKKSGYLEPDTRHFNGGVDILQLAAFNHLMPEGKCAWPNGELLYELAEIHRWKIQITSSDSL